MRIEDSRDVNNEKRFELELLNSGDLLILIDQSPFVPSAKIHFPVPRFLVI